MKLEFVPVEEFYFALTLSVRVLEDLTDPTLLAQIHTQLQNKYGQPSTVAPGGKNTFNYVFQVHDHDNHPSPQLYVSISDWQGKLRLSSDYGWMLNDKRQSVRTEKFQHRATFAADLKTHLETHLQVPFNTQILS